MIEAIVMDKINPVCWMLMPQFLGRVRKFSSEFTVTGADNAATWFESCFGTGDKRMLGIALVENGDNPGLVGHMLTGCESYLGVPCGMVYQFSKDKGQDFIKGGDETLYLMIRYMLESWCRDLDITQCYALVEGPARAKLFGWFGFSDNMRMIRMDIASVMPQVVGG